MAEHIDRKALKAPDAFQKAGLDARAWLAGRERLVLGLVVSAFALFGGFAVVQWFAERADARAALVLGETLTLLERPVGGTAGTASAAGDSEKPFSTQKEKDEALSAALVRFQNEHANTRSARAAQLPLASAALRLGKPDEAIRLSEDYLRHFSSGTPLRSAALEVKGYALEAKKDFSGAASVFDQMVAESADGLLRGMGHYHRARMLLSQDRALDAANAFEEATLAAPGSAAAQLARDRLETLARQGVFPSVVAATDAGTRAP
ncbi:MAG: tetratricopeptide repeat protein [Myxococcaceae bacterium]